MCNELAVLLLMFDPVEVFADLLHPVGVTRR